MTDLSIPEPNDSGDKTSRRSAGKKSRAERPQETRPPIASREECLAILNQLGKAVLVGLLTPGQATVIRGIYTDLLRYHERQESGPSRTVGNEKDLGKLLRKNPELGNLLEPLLSKEEIERLMGMSKDASDADEAV